MLIYIRAGYSWRIKTDTIVGCYANRCHQHADFVIEHDDGVFTLKKCRYDTSMIDSVTFTYADMIEVINKMYSSWAGHDAFGSAKYKAGKMVASYSFQSDEEVEQLLQLIKAKHE